jgi:superfamily II DNA or RNA helicase/HKD family nuclease
MAGSTEYNERHQVHFRRRAKVGDVKPGLYEQLVTGSVAHKLVHLDSSLHPVLQPVEHAEAPVVLTRHLLRVLQRALGALGQAQAPAETVNQLLLHLIELVQRGAVDSGDLLQGELRELLAIVRKNGLTQPKAPPRPSLPLNATDLLVNARDEARVGAEFFKELQSADRVDLLCSFLKWSGYRQLREPLKEVVQRGGQLRVLTTCYLGATDVRVVEELAEFAQVRVSYDTRRTRLHAKAWLFHRDSGFSTAYIGSSNLSAAAMMDGLEWNVRLSMAENGRVLEKFQNTFESYWEDGEFQEYRVGLDRERFLEASRRERSQPEPLDTSYTLEVRPYGFQREILERLQVEREVHGRNRNLVVAATGCGKTVIAALDYKRLGGRLLFVAHREEILSQSLRTFRAVLRDGQFGDLWTGRHQPTQGEHLFASVQKLHNQDLTVIAPEHFDVVIVDEFHHAEAPTYQRLLNHFRPKILLGLTATPERSDGKSIQSWFDHRVAAELRLWDALERGFLCPFQYFGVHDNTDLRDIPWRRGYDAGQLDRVYTGHHARAALIWKELSNTVADPQRMRALGFCAGISHAKFMAGEFHKVGIRTAVVVGETPREERQQSLSQLRKGELQIIFTVDVFNEGVDVPEVDTVLLLRPTESATIFLQQLGRGLRLSDGKECLTVLDFIGQANQHFRFDLMYRGLLGGTRRELVDQVEGGFPRLPSGCSIQLDRIARQIVLENLRRQLKGRQQLLQELRAVGEGARLQDFLERSGCELSEVYRGKEPGWTPLRRQVGFDHSLASEGEAPLYRSLARLQHMDSASALRFYAHYLNQPSPQQQLSASEERLLEMLRFSLWPRGERRVSALWELPPLRQEILELLEVLQGRIATLEIPLGEVPLMVHCRYSQAEILAGFGILTEERTHLIREGVYYHKSSNTDLLFVTIRKSEKDYSPSTMYQDYAVSPELFHWQSQSTTRADSDTGRRYQGGSQVLLFARESAKDAQGLTAAYVCLGPAEYLSHEGERPMSIIWKLRYLIPTQFYRWMRLSA